MGANAVTTVPVYTAGEVLTAADLNITNSGIPVFADSTARTAAFGGTGEKVLAEGQYAYLESDNSTSFWDGSAWQAVGVTPGLVPVVPTSVAVGSGTASVGATGLITFTTVGTSLSVNGCFSATYLNYLVVHNSSNSADSTLTAKLRASGSDTSTQYYYNVGTYYSNGATIDYLQGNNQTTCVITDTGAAERGMTMNIFNPFAAKITLINSQLGQMVSTRQQPSFSYGTQNSTTSFDGFTLFPSSGTMTGTMSIYGYAR